MEQHTCIKDDGGTPNRRCYACDNEKLSTKSLGKVIVSEGDQYGGWTRELEIASITKTSEGLVIYTK